jgi:hypothetical protein
MPLGLFLYDGFTSNLFLEVSLAQHTVDRVCLDDHSRSIRSFGLDHLQSR